MSSTTLGRRHESPAQSTHGRGTSALRLAAGVGAGLAAGAAVLAARQLHPLDTVVGVLVTVAALVLTPSARSVSRRLLLNGTVVLGWVQAIWWVDLSWLPVDRTSCLLAAWVAVVTGWLVSAGTRTRLARLRPEVHAADGLPFLAGAVATVALGNRLFVRDPVRALDVLAGGWDNAGHFAMFHMIRLRGVIVPEQAPPPDAVAWAYAQYPQGYHALAATAAEALSAKPAVSAVADLLAYSRTTALVAILSVVVVTAGLCSVERLRRNPLLLPLVSVATMLLSIGTGFELLRWGFPNFLLACVLVCCAFLVAVEARGLRDTPSLVAAGALLVGVAHNWFPMALLAAPLCVPVLLPLPGSGRSGRRPLIAAGVVLVTTAGGLLFARSIVSGVGTRTSIGLDGGFPVPSHGPAVTIAAIAIALGLARFVGVRDRHPWWSPDAQRALWTLATLVLAVVATCALALYQQHEFGKLSYYLWKFECGALLVVTLIGATYAVPSIPVPQVRNRLRLAGVWAGAIVAALGIGQAWGVTLPNVDLLTNASEGFPHVDTSIASPRPPVLLLPSVPTPTLAARDVIAAAVATGGDRNGIVAYLSYPTDMRTIGPDMQQWLLALTDEWTDRGMPTYVVTPSVPPATIDDAATVLNELLDTPGRPTVYVRSEVAADLVARLADSADAARVLVVP